MMSNAYHLFPFSFHHTGISIMTPALEIWWIWVAVAVLLAAAEIIVPGLFILPFIAGALAAGLLAYLGLSAAVQWTVFAVVSGVLLPLALVITKRITKGQPPMIDSNRMIGMRGPVTISVDNRENRGHVRLGGELWRAESESGGQIPVGMVVEVTAVEGIRVVVREVGNGR
jgi:membrane protein implicated in regulation of membrane protease activity